MTTGNTRHGIHHVTAIAGPARRNLDFYTRTLGLRLVKKTVNFDDPGTYHFYFGDETGTPGTILTFFPWEHAAPGRLGVGETQETVFRVPEGAIGYWTHRFVEKGVPHDAPARRFGDKLSAAFVLHGLGGIALETGDVTAAGEYIRESLDLRSQVGDQGAIADGLESTAAWCVAVGLAGNAARLFGAVHALRESAGMQTSKENPDGQTRHIECMYAHLGDEAFAAAWKAGTSLTLDRAIAEALAIRAG